MTQVSCWFLARHSPVAALSRKKAIAVKQNRKDRLPFSTNAQADVANVLAAKALF